MERTPLKLLLIEDNRDDAELLLIELEAGGYVLDAEVVETEAALRAALTRRHWDMVISDHNLPGLDSLQALDIVRAFDINIPFIITSGCIGEEVAVEAMKAGADDYVMKDKRTRLLPAIERSLREAKTRTERRIAIAKLEQSENRLRLMTDNVPCVMLQLVVSDGVMCVVHLSGGAEQQLGLDNKTIVVDPQQLFECFGELGRQLCRRLQTQREAGEIQWSGQVQHGPASGSWYDFRASSSCPADGANYVVWDGIFFDVTQQKKAELDVRLLNSRLREMAARANKNREEERSRISREIHDDLGGSLTALKIDLVRLQRSAPEQCEALEQMTALVDETVLAVRRICADLHPRILDDFGLQPAIEWYLERFEHRTGLRCSLQGAIEHELQRHESAALFRVFQEALTNIARHAHASEVAVELTVGEDGVLQMVVADDGIGGVTDSSDTGNSFGLLGMRERMRELGGRAHWEHVATGGTRFCAELPLKLWASIPTAQE